MENILLIVGIIWVLFMVIVFIIIIKPTSNSPFDLLNNVWSQKLLNPIINQTNKTITDSRTDIMSNNQTDILSNDKYINTNENEDFKWIYNKKHYFFSISELHMYRLLKNFFQKEYNWRYAVFPKVGLVDFIEVDKYKPNYRSFFSKMAQKHVDFLIVDQNMYCTPVLAIELNGSSHKSDNVKKRDIFVWNLYRSIKLNLITFQNYNINSENNVINNIKKCLP